MSPRSRRRRPHPWLVRPLAAAALVWVALPAGAQVAAVLEREAGGLGGVPVTVPGVAAAEEATALAVNPAGLGLVGDLQLAWQHESGVTDGSRGDALFAATPFGPFGLGLGLQWIRPGDGGGDRWRKLTFGLAAGDQGFSVGVSWNWYVSPDRAIDRAESWDAGLTLRPTRHLSFSASAMNRDLRVGGVRLPVRYDVGLGVRLWDDTLTLTADLVGDDLRRDDLRATHAAFGLGLEHPSGAGLSGQVQLPIRDGVRRGTLGVLAFTWNGGHSGVSLGGHPGEGWLGGVRLSGERYPSATPLRTVPSLDVDRELQPRYFVVWEIGERDRWGALLERLARLRDDREVGGVVLRLSTLDLGPGRAEELRQAIAGIAVKKPVLAYLEGGDTRTYWAASAATAVAAAPGTTLFVTGVGRSRLYLKDTLARAGVTVEVVKVGAYKSAPEPLTQTGSSPEAREAEDALLDDVFGRFVADVAAARKLEPERVRALLGQGLYTSEDATTAGLIDAVLWPDELEGWARARTGARLVGLGRYEPPTERAARRWGEPAVVEIIRVEGTIARGRSRQVSGSGLAGAETISAEIRRAAEDRDVKAIVLRIESPGGDGAAGDLIWREVTRARAKKPVVASMGDLAASAGYLVAAGANAIVAEPSTITGSIGVFAVKPDLSGLLERLSVKRESARRGENAELLSLTKPWTSAERAAVQKAVDQFYASFVEKVAAGRGLSKADVEAVAGGRVWSGRAARERRLVDQLGSLEDAVALAREKAGLDPGDAVTVRRGGERGVGLAGGAVRALARAAPGVDALERAASLLPELTTLAVLSELGPVLALPEDWLAGSAR